MLRKIDPITLVSSLGLIALVVFVIDIWRPGPIDSLPTLVVNNEVQASDGELPPSDDGPQPALVAAARTQLRTITVHALPDGSSGEVYSAEVSAEAPVHFLAVRDYGTLLESRALDEWLEVYVPVRPNGTSGFVRLSDVELYSNPYRIEIDVSEFRLTVLELGKPIIETQIAVGTGSTPTPLGQFYTTDVLEVPDPDDLYGPYALALSGYSETITSFRGGDGLVGIHGTNDPTSLGTEVSHGCVRVENEIITEMARLLPLGTPVVIEA